MNKQIQEIQKNMQTTFEGYVNGQTFTDRDAMNKFIGQCISEGKPITGISYSTSTSYVPNGHGLRGKAAIDHAQEEISWIKYINNVNKKVPQPYDSVIGYIVPFIHEDIHVDETNSQIILNDFKACLVKRMQFLESNIFEPIRSKNYDVSQVHSWLDNLIFTLVHKMDWANQRVKMIEKFINEMPDDKFITSHTNVEYFRCFCDIYTETSGFCSALIDICKEFQK